MEKLISIIIPVYNQEKYLVRCLDSVKSQSYQNFEAILIDDGSKDSSPALCDAYVREDPRFSVLHIQNGGVSNARNMGLKIAKGEYISFLDSDDYWHPDCLMELSRALDNSPNSSIAVANYFNAYEDGAISENVSTYTGELNVFRDYDYGSDYCLRHVWGMLIHRSFLEGAAFSTDLFVGEDCLFMAQLFCRNPNVVFVDSCLYYYTCLPDSASHGKIDRKKATTAEAWSRVIALYEKHGCSRKVLAGVYLSLFRECREGVKKILLFRNADPGLLALYRKPIRKNLLRVLLSALSVKDKGHYAIFAVSPKGYTKWLNHRKRETKAR